MWPENVGFVSAFLAGQSQWRTGQVGGGLGGVRILWVGLDYVAVRASLDALEIAVTPELWSALQIMEAEARLAMNGDE